MAITERRNAGKDINPVHTSVPIKKKKTGKGKYWFIVIFILSIALLAFASYRLGVETGKLPSVHMTNAFVDVNADGKPDLILNADVIINTGQVSFPTSQP